jgi:hypothetical protein
VSPAVAGTMQPIAASLITKKAIIFLKKIDGFK